MERGARVSGSGKNRGHVARVPKRPGDCPDRLRLGDVARLLVVWIMSSAALAIADVLFEDMIAEAWWAYLAATAVAGVLGLAFRPALALMATRIGWLAVFLPAWLGRQSWCMSRSGSRRESPLPSGRRSGRRGSLPA